MIIKSKNFELKLAEFHQEEISAPFFNDTEKKVLGLVKKWMNGEKKFVFKTSGSTGKPKIIEISREKIEYSTRATLEYIDPAQSIRSALLCLDPDFIGGAMVVFRALIKALDLYILEPTSEVMTHLPGDYSADLVSVVPMQFASISVADARRFRYLLIGGAPLTASSDDFHEGVFATYGMTETVSHIGLRKLKEPHFTLTGDCIVRENGEGCLEFKGTITHNQWLVTHDIGEVISDATFKWIGRKDFIINSGGIKFSPEAIEGKLKGKVPDPFMITSVPDPTLGEKIVLLTESQFQPDFSSLRKYEIPKQVLSGIPIERTASGKIDRIKTKEHLLKALDDEH